MRQLYAHDYRAAGLATLARQVTLGGIAIMPYVSRDPVTWIAQFILKSVAHQANMAIKTLENVAAMATILVEQAAYPLLLQTSHEIDELMATQIPLEKGQVNLFKMIHPFFLTTSPLAYLSLGNYIDSFEAQIAAHQSVLDHFNTLWTWIEKTEVTYVIDGDTICVAEYPNMSVRLEGIDAPEMDTPEGEEAKAYVEERLLGQQVKLRARTQLDKYGRVIAKVYFPGDKNFAWEIMAAGHAKVLYSTWFF